MNVGLLEKNEKCSLKKGKKYIDGYDRDGFNEEGYDIFEYNNIGFNKDYIHKNTGTKYDEHGFYYDKQRESWINIYSNNEFDLLGYNVYGYDKMGFERPKGVVNGRYIVPKWHRRKEDGTYDSHAYYMRPADNEYVSQDAHEFKGHNKDNGPDRKYDNKNETNPDGFYSYGARRKKPSITSKNPLNKDDFYDENGLDIDKYNKDGFKLITIDDKQKYIHRDTSCEYDRKGRLMENGILKVDQSIFLAKEIIRLMLYSGKNKKEVCGLYAKLFNATPEEIEKDIKETLEKAFTIYETSSPNAFDEDEKKGFKGLNKYYFLDSNSTEKKKRIKEFFEICPRAKEILIRESKEKLRILQILEQKEKLTDDEIKIKRELQSKEKQSKEYLEELNGR